MSRLGSRAAIVGLAVAAWLGTVAVGTSMAVRIPGWPAAGIARPAAETDDGRLNAELDACIDHAGKLAVPAGMDLDLYARVWQLCENRMYDQLLLNDFFIRRRKFAESSLDERVNLWLVVTITLSGVVLAGLQLAMSYRLARDAKTELMGSSELAVEQGRLSVKSSVTGLLIMALSLAFFVIYIKFVYQNFDVVTEKPDNLKAQAPAGRLVSGGSLGWVGQPRPVPATQDGAQPQSGGGEGTATNGADPGGAPATTRR